MKKLIVIIGLLTISVVQVEAQQQNNQFITPPPFHQIQLPPALPTEKSSTVSQEHLALWHIDALTQHGNLPSPQAVHHHGVVIFQHGQQENQLQPTARRLFDDEAAD